MNELDGKIALITGAGSGMGRATARVCHREGARVVAVDISGRQDDTATELGDGALAVRADVSSEPDVEAMFAAAVDQFGRVDIVCNVAGISDAAPLADLPVDQFDRIMAVNLRGVMLGTKHAIRTMLDTGGGVILNWASGGALNASRMPISAYSASKAGVVSFTKAAAVEYGRKGIRANAVVPGGLILTEMSGGDDAAENLSFMIDANPLRRACEPEEVAELACFLASDRAPFMNGAVVTIDGGQSAVLA